MIRVEHGKSFIDIDFNVEVIDLQKDEYIVRFALYDMSENMYELVEIKEGHFKFDNLIFDMIHEVNGHKEISECIGTFMWMIDDFISDYR